MKLQHRAHQPNNQKTRVKRSTIFNIISLITITTGLVGFGGCDVFPTDSNTLELTIDDTDFETSDWTTATHSKSADPDFDEVFDDTQVKRFDISMTSARWQLMLDDMTNFYGEFGRSNQGPPGNGPGGVDDISDENPIFVPADVFYNDTQWYRVGMRFKGNSSLMTSWKSGILKLSLKLDFDEFEDDYTQIDNQRFYGFKKLSLKNNYDDSSFLREKAAAEVFEDAGLAVSHTAFYEVYIDHGDGPKYFGLYTLVEEVDDTVIETQFASDEGNLYKPEYDGASFAAGSFNESDFTKKTNEDDGDWSDIQTLFEALHANTRFSNPAEWRTDLDSIFDTDVFLRYLAVNTVIQNWDTYGVMTHNYYLYNNPETDKLTWIPWDNNEALQEGKMGGSLNLNFSDLHSEAWPLIEYLYDDDVYRSVYQTYVREVRDNWFEPSAMQSKYNTYADLVEPYATSEISGYTFLYSDSEFRRAISTLSSHVNSRAISVDYYLP